MELLIGILIGIISGAIVTNIIYLRQAASGSLRIDQSDPDDKPYLFLELKSAEVMKKKYVLLHIRRENFISQK